MQLVQQRHKWLSLRFFAARRDLPLMTTLADTKACTGGECCSEGCDAQPCPALHNFHNAAGLFQPARLQPLQHHAACTAAL